MTEPSTRAVGIPFQAVIFDMDGVLLDSEPLHYEALRAVLADEGHEWPWEYNEKLLGTTVVDSFRIIDSLVPLANSPESYIPTYNRRVLEVLESGSLQPAAGVTDLIANLRSLGVPLAVASSSLRSWVNATIRGLGIANCFEAIVAGDEIENGKPAPDIYLRAAEHLDLSPSVCLAIEDAPNGVKSAAAAGMKVIAVRTPYTAGLSLEQADLIVDSLSALTIRPALAGWIAACQPDSL